MQKSLIAWLLLLLALDQVHLGEQCGWKRGSKYEDQCMIHSFIDTAQQLSEKIVLMAGP